MSTTQPPSRNDARERLLTATQELFAEQGMTSTTPRQVMQRSGVGQGSLYHHFPTKRDLAAAAISRTSADTLDRARTTLRGDGRALERLRSYLTRPRDALAGCHVGRLTSDQAVMSDDELREPVRDYFVQLVDLVADVLAESGLNAEAAQRLGTTAIAVIQGGYVLSRAIGDPAPMDQAISGLVELLEQTSS